jgi:N-acetylneuraminic acid mutarotase
MVVEIDEFQTERCVMSAPRDNIEAGEPSRLLPVGPSRARRLRVVLRVVAAMVAVVLVASCLFGGRPGASQANALSIEDLLRGGLCGQPSLPPATPLPRVSLAAAPELTTTQLNTFTKISWANGASCPLALSESESALVNGNIYVFGGFDYPIGPITQSRIYEQATNKWFNIASLPQKLTHVGVAQIGSTIYFAGGYVGTPNEVGYGQTFGTVNCYMYSANTNRFSAMTNLPIPRSGGALVEVGNTLHYFGGFNIQGRTDSNLHYILDLSNPKAQWQLGKAMPLSRNHMAYVNYYNKVYLIAGQTGTDAGLVTKSDVQIYDPTTNSWSKGANMPHAVSHISNATFIVGDRILVLGGETANGIQTNTVYAYKPATNSWQQLSNLPAARLSGVARMINNKIVFTTGGNDSNTWVGTPEP